MEKVIHYYKSCSCTYAHTPSLPQETSRTSFLGVLPAFIYANMSKYEFRVFLYPFTYVSMGTFRIHSISSSGSMSTSSLKNKNLLLKGFLTSAVIPLEWSKRECAVPFSLCSVK